MNKAALNIREWWYGERGGTGVQDGEHVYACGGFMLMCGRTNTILLSNWPPIKINKFKLKKEVHWDERRKGVTKKTQITS